MHAPDGFYSIGLCVTINAVCLAIIGYCIKKVWRRLDRHTITLAAAVAAFVFSVEMANFSVTRGSSCHFMGGVFAAIVLGPFMSTIVVSLMHVVQAMVFQDGGMLSLGPNLLTIVIISTFLGYYLYKIFKSLVIEPYGTYIGAFISSWLTLLITAITVCLMLAVSGIDSLAVTLGPMVGPHVMVGVMEGIVTILLLIVIQNTGHGWPVFSRVRIIKQSSPSSCRKKGIKTWLFLLTMSLLIAVIVSPFASREPDGLEKLAMDCGFAETNEVVYFRAPFSGYKVPCISNEKISSAFAGFMGVFITFGLSWLLGMIFFLKGQKGQKEETREGMEEVISP
ncbi:energy-coupling factor ABC transporter permease [bacterium]|nr:energy-coupling factor ABC transporter permease [bacterium]